MLPNQASQRPPRGWGRLVVRTLTAVVLLPVPLFALTQLAPGLVSAAAGDSAPDDKGARASANPLTFDAPARTVGQAAAQQKDAARDAARLARIGQEEATVLDDWHFTRLPPISGGPAPPRPPPPPPPPPVSGSH